MSVRRVGVTVFLFACGARTPEPGPVVTIAPPSASADTDASGSAPVEPPPEEPLREVHGFLVEGGVELPKGYAFDGAVGEWPDGPEIRFVLTSAGLTIAGTLPEHAPASDVITVAFDFPQRELPTIGAPLRGGGVAELNCETSWDGQPLDDAEKVRCEGVMAEANAFRADWASEAQRTWHLSSRGVTTSKGVPVAGARAAVVKGARVTFEAELPLGALPLAAESPVGSALTFVTTELREVDRSTRNMPAAIFDGVKLGAASGLRARALEEWGIGLIDGVPSVGYRLGDDATWLVGRRALGWASYERAEVPLFVEEAKHKDLAIGRLYAGLDRLAVVKQGEIVALESAIQGEIVGTVKRAPGLHVFAVDSYRDEVGNMIAGWTVYTVADDGEIGGGGLPSPVFAWADVRPVHDKQLKTFGFVGQVAQSETPREVSVTWSWSAREKTYEPKVTGLD